MSSNLPTTNSPSPTVAGSVTTPSSRPPPFREDCWTEDATATLVDAWGRRYVELNRGNLRQKDWQDVADAVNDRHGHTKKTRRTDVQCKNRIDTLKKKYKVEKARVSGSGSTGQLTSNWRFYNYLDSLIGVNNKKSSPAPSPAPEVMTSPPSGVPLPYRKPSPAVRKSPTPAVMTSPPTGVPLTYRKTPPGVMTSAAVATMRFQSPQPLAILPRKRASPVAAAAVDESYFRRNYSAVAAAAAAAEVDCEEEEMEEEDDESVSSEEEDDGVAAGVSERAGIRKESGGGADAMRRLSRAIERFGEIYERVEGEKQKQMIELEKQRMKFTKDLEIQRMQLFMDTQVQLEKIKQAKRTVSDDDDVYS